MNPGNIYMRLFKKKLYLKSGLSQIWNRSRSVSFSERLKQKSNNARTALKTQQSVQCFRNTEIILHKTNEHIYLNKEISCRIWIGLGFGKLSWLSSMSMWLSIEQHIFFIILIFFV